LHLALTDRFNDKSLLYYIIGNQRVEMKKVVADLYPRGWIMNVKNIWILSRFCMASILFTFSSSRWDYPQFKTLYSPTGRSWKIFRTN